MDIFTTDSRAAEVVKRWEAAYLVNGVWSDTDKKAKGYALRALRDPSPEMIYQILGNSSWTDCKCAECGTYAPVIVLLGNAEICKRCLKQALKLIKEAK